MMPDFIVGKHHRILADMLMGIERGIKTVFVSIFHLRHGKSQLVSIFFPAWFLVEPRQEGYDGVTHHRPSGRFRA